MKKKPLEIVVLQGGGRGARHPLVAPHVVLGRLEPMETAGAGSLLFPEPTVSRIHATLDWDAAANRYLLTHRSATNPTLVNKAKVTKPRHIAPGDKIQMGNLLIEIRVGVGQHAEVELETVDFTALTKLAANQVYRPETVMPEAPAVPAAGPQAPQEISAPIPAPIPPPVRRQLPPPVFTEPYAPVEPAPAPVPVAARPEAPAVSQKFFEFPEADEQVAPVQQGPRRIVLSSLPTQQPLVVEENRLELDERIRDLEPLEETGVLGVARPPVEVADDQAVTPETVEVVDEEATEPEADDEQVCAEALEVTEEAAPEPAPETPGKPEEEVSASEPAGAAQELLPEPVEADQDTELTNESSETAPTETAQTQEAAEPAARQDEEAPLTSSLEMVEEPVLVEPEAVEPEPPPEKPKQKPIRREKPKVGRNQKCPCGSGKKYKKCCGQ